MTAVADRVLGLRRELREGGAERRVEEERVVAEAAGAPRRLYPLSTQTGQQASIALAEQVIAAAQATITDAEQKIAGAQQAIAAAQQEIVEAERVRAAYLIELKSAVTAAEEVEKAALSAMQAAA